MRRRRCARSERERDADGNDRTDDEREHDAAARTPQRFAWHRAIVARFGPRRRVSAPAAPRRDLAGLIGQVHLPRVLLTKKARWRMQGRSPDDQAFASVDCLDRTVPDFDPGALERLTVRFGSEVVAWFDELPHLLTALAELWQLELGAPIPRGTASAVFSCRMTSGRRAVLKVSPDRPRLALEAAALAAWRTVHTPTMIAFDERGGQCCSRRSGKREHDRSKGPTRRGGFHRRRVLRWSEWRGALGLQPPLFGVVFRWRL